MTTPYYSYKTRPFPPGFFPPKEPDWPAILNEFIRRGIPKAELARALNVSRERIYCYLRGTRAVTYGEGILLISALRQLRSAPGENNSHRAGKTLDNLGIPPQDTFSITGATPQTLGNPPNLQGVTP